MFVKLCCCLFVLIWLVYWSCSSELESGRLFVFINSKGVRKSLLGTCRFPKALISVDEVYAAWLAEWLE